MAYKSILTVATQVDKTAATIRAVAAVCLKYDAHLDILALGIDKLQVGYAYVGASAGMIQVVLEQVEEAARDIEATVRKAIAAEPPDLRWQIETAVTQLGALTDLVALNARFCDLVVLPKPYGTGADPTLEAVMEAALFEGQAPVLIVPEPGLGSLPFANIVIIKRIWDFTR